MKVSRRADCTPKLFWKRTISAQIHFVTLLLAIAGLCYLLPFASQKGIFHFWGTLAFGLTGILVFAVSSFYHFIHDGFQIGPDLESIMEKLDHYSIYLFIAGTYTPFLLNVLKSPWKEILIIAIWTIALSGILYTAFRHKLPKWAQSRALYTGLFVLMGWTMLVRILEIFAYLDAWGVFLFAGGAVAYSVGAIVYATKKPKLFEGFFGFHELWHSFVTLGFAFHYFLIVNFYVT